MNIDIIYSSKNYTIIRDNMTRYIWLYSYGKPIVYYNGILHFNSNNGNMTQSTKNHFTFFKKLLDI